MVFCALKPY
jgi:hypothetical protein